MLTANQMADHIDRHLALYDPGSGPMHVGRVSEGILAALSADDRAGIDPAVLRMRVMARGMGFRALTW